MTKPRSKYGAKPTVLYGIRFASKFEGEIYMDLRDMLARKEITDLRCQPVYPLNVGGERIGVYRCDFCFQQKGREVALEAKGFETDIWKWKRKHFEAQYRNVELRVAKAGSVAWKKAA